MLTCSPILAIFVFVFFSSPFTTFAQAGESEPIFAGVWSQKEPNGVGGLFYDMSWDGLVSKWNELGKKNQYLSDVEVYRQDGKWRYTGLWRIGPGNGDLYSASWTDFVKLWNKLKEDKDLIDVEVIQTDHGLSWLGVWREKQGRDRGIGNFQADLTWEELISRWNELGADQYLSDVETYVDNGKRLFVGVWRVGRGSGNDALYLTRDWQEFAKKKQSLNATHEMLDFEMYQTGDGQWNFLGVWRQSSTQAGPLSASHSDQQFRPLTASQFLDKWEQRQPTHTLVDLEIAVPFWPDIEKVKYLGNFPAHRQSGWSHNLQGVANDASNWFFTQMTVLWKFPVAHDLNGKVTEADPGKGILKASIPQKLRDQGFDHFGDPDHYSGYIFIPLEGGKGNTGVAVYKASDLSFVTFAPLVLSDGRRQPFAGWVAIHPISGLLYTSDNEIDGARPIYIYEFNLESLKQGELKLKHHDKLFPKDEQGRKMHIKSYLQGGVFSSDGHTLFISNGQYKIPKEESGLWLFDAHSGKKLLKSVQDGEFEFTFHPKGYLEEPEGITFWNLEQGKAPRVPGGQLHAILLDNDVTSESEFYFKHYRIHYDKKP